MRHFVIVGVLVILVAVLTYIGLDSIGLMPVAASAQAIPIDWMWNWQVIAISFLFALIVVPMAFKHRREYFTGNSMDCSPSIFGLGFCVYGCLLAWGNASR